jgi:hypothetical protein
MSLDCMCSSCVLCTRCCRCLWIVCRRPVYCVPNVVDVSGLYVFVLCYRQHWVHKTQNEDIQSRDIDNIGYTIHRTKTYNTETSTTMRTQYTERRHTIQRHRQHWVHNTQDEDILPIVVDVSGLYVFVMCLVYPMLSISLDCMSSFCVLCTQCCRCLWIVCLRPVYCVPNVVRRHTIQRHRQHWVHNTQDEDIQSRDIDNIGYTKHRTKTYNPETSTTLGIVFLLCLVYPMLSMFLDCMSSSCVLYTQCCRCLWIVCLRPVSCVPNVVDVSGLYVFVLCLVYPMLQSRDIDNVGYTIHRTKTCNPETSTTLGIQDTGRRHTIQKL